MTHTPAPWLYARVDETTEAVVTAEGDSIFDVRGASPADLRLLSAAPDLLAALRDFSAAFHKGDGDCTAAQLRAKKAARAAIVRATG